MEVTSNCELCEQKVTGIMQSIIGTIFFFLRVVDDDDDLFQLRYIHLKKYNTIFGSGLLCEFWRYNEAGG